MKYAIVESGGKQYKAVEGETIEVDRLPVEIGENIKFEQVLLLVDGDSITVGTPLVKDTPVWTTIVAHFRGEKVTIFNYRPKKRIRVKIGHRQNYTRLLVEQIGGAALVKKAEPVEEKLEAEVEVVAEVEEKETKKPVKKVAEKPAAEKKPKAAPKKAATKSAPAKTTKTTKTPAKKSASK
jgi:large subunit ribosomal protein L21